MACNSCSRLPVISSEVNGFENGFTILQNGNNGQCMEVAVTCQGESVSLDKFIGNITKSVSSVIYSLDIFHIYRNQTLKFQSTESVAIVSGVNVLESSQGSVQMNLTCNEFHVWTSPDGIVIDSISCSVVRGKPFISIKD